MTMMFRAKVDAVGDVTIFVTSLTDFVQAPQDASLFVYDSDDKVLTVTKGDLRDIELALEIGA